MSKSYKTEKCRVCENKEFECILTLNPTPLADSYISAEFLKEKQEEYPIELFKCKKCGLVQIGYIIDVEEVYLSYIYETISSPGLIEHFRHYAKNVYNTLNIQGKNLFIDIGSNDGTLLRFMKEKGMDVLGIDPSPKAAKIANDAGLETLEAFFSEEYALNEILPKYGKAKLITSNNLVADVDNLQDMLKGVRVLLDNNGIFCFESFYFLDQVKNLVFDFTYHEHFSYFTVEVVKNFLEYYDLELINAERVSTKGGSMHYTIQIKDGPRKIQQSVQKLIDEENDYGINNLETFIDYKKRIETAKTDLINTLDKIKAKGQTIVGFGASATSTTLIYHFELGKYLDYLVDDYKAKQGLFSPGLHIPVYSGDKIYETKPDYVLVLAWRFYKPIVKNYSKYTDDGGKFIIPLPELKKIEN